LRARDGSATVAKNQEGSSMTDASSAAPAVHGYHAHIYYDKDTAPVAAKLRATIEATLPVEVGALRDEPVGPHPVSQFAVIFRIEQFQSVVPWLMLHRDGLDILVHPLTEDMVDDHSVYALWLGAPVDLLLNTMQRRGYGSALLPAA
jgi:aromatic ring-cleaving dioxygenase